MAEKAAELDRAESSRRAHDMQYRMRQQAMEQSDMLQGLGSWQAQMKKRDEEMRRAAKVATSAPIRGRGRTAPPPPPEPRAAKPAQGTAARHTYDQGYKKWEDFDVDAALQADDREDEAAATDDAAATTTTAAAEEEEEEDPQAEAAPADPEAAQRAVGNEAFKVGDYAAAIKSYTICLGLKRDNATAFSNRAMAYLKLNQYNNAEKDADAALRIDPDHVKALVRRATARHALGKHRAALLDCERAADLDGATNKAVSVLRTNARTALSAAVHAAPLSSIPIVAG